MGFRFHSSCKGDKPSKWGGGSAYHKRGVLQRKKRVYSNPGPCIHLLFISRSHHRGNKPRPTESSLLHSNITTCKQATLCNAFLDAFLDDDRVQPSLSVAQGPQIKRGCWQ